VAHLRDLGVATTGLVLFPSDNPGTDRTVVGDAREPATVVEALSDVDAVARSVSARLPAGRRRLPSKAADAYALSKQTDELTAAMMWRRYGLSVVALRLPFLGEPGRRLRERAHRYAEHPEAGARDLWSYLDDRDASRACVAALTLAPHGFHVVGLAAPVRSAVPDRDPARPVPPGCAAPPGPFLGECPLWTPRRARTLLGFEVEQKFLFERWVTRVRGPDGSLNTP
jgi:nucleoside-diphosphate-sugar epimerase